LYARTFAAPCMLPSRGSAQFLMLSFTCSKVSEEEEE